MTNGDEASASPIEPGDRDLRRRFKARPSVETFAPLVRRYLPLVSAAARRQSRDEAQAAETTKAVFLTLANRARKLRRREVLAGWLFHTTRIAAAKSERMRKRAAARGSLPASVSPEPPVVTERLWTRAAPWLDAALGRLPVKLRNAVLLGVIMNRPDAAANLGLRQRRFDKRARQGMRKLSRRLRRRGVRATDTGELERECRRYGSAAVIPEGLEAEILEAAQNCFRRQPAQPLARAVLRSLAWGRWRARLKAALASVGAVVMLVVLLAATGALLWRSGHLLPWILEWSVRMQVRSNPELAREARPWPGTNTVALPNARTVATAGDLYKTTHVWPAHLKFTADQWEALAPKRVPPVRELMRPDNTVMLRNPNALRNGLAGALGFQFEWTPAAFEFGGVSFDQAGARIRGNGTFLGSLYGAKRSIKVDLNRFTKGQKLGEVEEMNFLNAIEDSSYCSDTLGYELFRAAGCPAPRTAFAWLEVSVAGKWERKPLGLYVMVEAIDEAFAEEWFGDKRTPIFKPVTYELFHDLGPNWAAYSDIYDLKTKASRKELRRVIEFARLVTHASDAEFSRRVGEFLDLDEFAGFLAGSVLLSNYDGFLSTGQNFFLYLDPRSDRFGFIPWDLDHSWGEFPLIGTPEGREQASIWHPWASPNRFLERVMAVGSFREAYRAKLEEMLASVFRPEHLFPRIDELASVARGPVSAESDYRLRRFDQAVSEKWIDGPRDRQLEGPKKPPHQIKRFISHRVQSVRDQLDGKSAGVLLRFGGTKK
jgi:DNA-directed RNA polymerase specialized sigma24 family protein